MFLARRPAPATIMRIVDESRHLALSYAPIGIVKGTTSLGDLDQITAVIGHGRDDFDRARAALIAWRHFNLGWVELFPAHAPIAEGTVVVVLIRHLGFWSVNGCRVVYTEEWPKEPRFGFAYGTLTNHAESGEEIFEVSMHPETQDVIYRIRATSRPRALLARLGRPIVRRLQARFRRDSVAAMKRALA
jgi:uncharacterized protein (UPF0548 family)